MRAAVLRTYAAPPEPGEFDEPKSLGDGPVVVEVLAAGINPVDLAMASGTFYGGSPALPCVVGKEGVGRLEDGTIAYFDASVAPYGSIAERTLINPAAAIPLPDQELDPALAVVFGIAGLAGWLALEWRARLREGETVLVLGASGIVGQVAVQAARLLGAGRVVAAARRTDALPGHADAAVTLEGDDVADRLREASGGDGYDVVVDPVWGEPAAAAAQACRADARLVNLGQSAGTTSPLTSASVRGTPLAILGHSNFSTPPEVRRAAYEKMTRHAAAGELTAPVERIALADVADAWRRPASSPRTKLVVVP